MITGWEWLVAGVVLLIALTVGPKALAKFAYWFGKAKKIYEYARKTELTEKEKKELEGE